MIYSVGTFYAETYHTVCEEHSIWDILGYIPTILVVTRIAPSIISPKSHLYVMYDVFLLLLLAANDDLRIRKRFL